MLTARLNRERARRVTGIRYGTAPNPESFARPVNRRSSDPQAGEGCRIAVLLAADAFGVALEKIAAATRGPAEVARARQAAMYIAHVALGTPLIAVGRYFGRDRSTAAHGCRRVEDRRDDTAYDAVIAELALAARIALHLDREIAA